MRISDWSSDVCSSDLLSRAGIMRLHEPPEHRVEQHAMTDGPAEAGTRRKVRIDMDRIVVAADPGKKIEFGLAQAADKRMRGHRQIGRASCRERVCQYV